MKNDSKIGLYRKHYGDVEFERTGLFEFVRENYACGEVLYPGCFIHITPSFYFPHVVYVDKDPIAADFFADQVDILQFINRNKRYKRSAYIQFFACDYLQEMPFAKGQFDILMALYAGGIAHACKKYLKTGGILVTNNFHKDAESAAFDDEYQLISVVHRKKKTYAPVYKDSKYLLDAFKKASVTKYIKQTSQGIEYTEPDDYFIFRKCRAKESSVIPKAG
jgi:hypothetical protein